MNSQTTPDFRKRLMALPPDVRQKARQTYKVWQKDPSHPSLHFKRINENRPLYSVRITLKWRSVGLLKEDTMIWFWIGNHQDYDRLVNQL
ncbi:MAG TPA: hypothetical protein PLJ62_11570 [Thermoflexales bacterium]|nr:hypothetical protein [Thermoflexales bacterium]HQW34189.1 hypothetical protein [Thermoflexales bacterium]HQZ20843.1 hypothetical protein [Thermoflexales bacterium]HRA00831.1 hypothetical protein [Thermoflexales bacterium]